jgi:stearoyl-CoA desaturase (delta-9 desaturase)
MGREGIASAAPPRLSLWRVGVFAAFHLLALAAIWTGVSGRALVACFAVFSFQLLSATIGYHRYFAHRAFQTSRVMQLVLALCAQASVQKGVLWWAAHHRYHHRHSDQDDDIHSPKHGLVWSYVGWIFYDTAQAVRTEQISDLLKYRELRVVDRWPFAPGIALAIVCYLALGWQGLVVGFVWATILSHHVTFANNCFAHIFGSRRYDTDDRSRNNWFLAAVTYGEGWHNNHHRYPGAARHGFMWWEIDLTYYVLLLLKAVGLIWSLRDPPPELLAERVSIAPMTRTK